MKLKVIQIIALSLLSRNGIGCAVCLQTLAALLRFKLLTIRPVEHFSVLS